MVQLTETIARTKITLPVPREHLVTRRRLTNALDSGAAGRLALVCAPAGYGKTTLLSQWIRQSGRRCAWVSLDETDNDPVRFWRCVIQALSAGDALPFAERAARLMQELAAMPAQPVIDALINELLAAAEPIVLVLDDIHLIADSKAMEDLAYFIDHAPESVYLILSGRSEPPFPTAKWMARGECVRLEAEMLQFTLEEARLFYEEMIQLRLSPEQLQRLFAKTEGWAAALQLMSLSIRGEAEPDRLLPGLNGANRHIADYLFEEVLSKLPAPLRSFLLGTSVLQRLNAEACYAVTGRADGQRMLDRLRADHLFLVPLDDNRTWFRYHHLFAEYLQNQLRRTDEGRWLDANRAAAEWLAQRGVLDAAIDHAFAASDFAMAESLMAKHAMTVVQRGEFATLLRWFDRFPADADLSPDMLLLCAFTCIVTGQPERAQALLDDIERSRLRTADAETAASIRSGMLFVQSNLLFSLGNFEQWFSFANGMSGDILPHNPIFYSFNYNRAKPWVRLTDLGHGGFLSADMEAIAHQFTGVLESHGWGSSLINLYVVQSLCEGYYEWNRLEECEALIHKLEAIGRTNETPGLFVPNRMVQAAVHAARRQTTAALDTLEEAADALPDDDSSSHWRRFLFACRARILLSENRVKEAKQAIAELHIAADDKPSSNRHFEYAALSRLLAAQRKEAEALRILERLKTLARREQCVMNLVEVCVLQACCYHKLGYREPSLRSLHEALAAGEPNGYVRSFVDEGETMRRLLQQYMAARSAGTRSPQFQGVSEAYAAKLLQLLPATDARARLRPGAANADAVTPAEAALLRMVREGANNRQIAERMALSEGTVKVYLSRLYGKLDVTSRTQALLAAEQLGLLDD